MIRALAPPNAQAGYRHLAEQVRAAGLLERRPWVALVRIVLTIGAYAAGWYALFLLGNSWTSLGVAAFLAVMFTQVLFIGHDAGHQQLFASRRANWLVGLFVGDLLTGLSFSWWVPKHNAHHAFPNQIGRDPDIGPGAVPHASEREERDSFQRCVHVLRSVPLVALEVGMHLSSGRSLAERRGRSVVIEWALIAMHAALYFFAVFSVLSPIRALAFIALQQALFGLYLRVSFAPNHKGMPIIESAATVGFVERQVITSRNVTGGRLTNVVLGGLNYQIEHHLFPTMPRANLARVQPLIREFCAAFCLDYREETLFGSYRAAARSLRPVRTDSALHGLEVLEPMINPVTKRGGPLWH